MPNESFHTEPAAPAEGRAAADSQPPAISTAGTAQRQDSTPEQEMSPQALLATQVTGGSKAASHQPIANPLPASTNLAEPRPPAMLGEFRLVSKLGEGAMGVVYKGFQQSAQREVAVKVLFPHMAKNTRLLERFYQEARIMGRLEHPNIVAGYAVGEEQGWHYFAMEFVDGRSLQKWLGLLGRLSIGDALHITLACADALRYAHELDLVHRDIKPDNILITRQGSIKITDLGAVKQLSEDLLLTQTGHGIGTPAYMPLEQAKNAKESDGRSDIYALGCVLYCMLTGRPPFTGATLVDLIQAKEMGTFPKARRLNPAVSERLDLIIDKMIAKQVKYRYQTCAGVIRDIQNLRNANPSLTFVPPESSVTTTPNPDVITPRPDFVPEAASADAGGDTPETSTEPEFWYVRYKLPLGPIVTRKLTTGQVVELIQDEGFDTTAVASRTLTGGYRSLSRFRQFEALLASRTTKNAIDRQTSRIRSLYKQIDEQDQKRQEESAAGDGAEWAALLYRLAVIGIGGAFVFVGLRLLLQWFQGFKGTLW
jgi:serine/threonine-protein kinase